MGGVNNESHALLYAGPDAQGRLAWRFLWEVEISIRVGSVQLVEVIGAVVLVALLEDLAVLQLLVLLFFLL